MWHTHTCKYDTNNLYHNTYSEQDDNLDSLICASVADLELTCMLKTVVYESIIQEICPSPVFLCVLFCIVQQFL